MKARFQHLGFETSNDSIHCYWVKAPRFGFHWHYHPEIEITYVHRGRGIRMVGDNLGYFRSGDLVFLGSNLPHTWISDDDFNQSPEDMEVVVLQFTPSIFPETWLNLPEMEHLRYLLKNGSRGINLGKQHNEYILDLVLSLPGLAGFERLKQILELLNQLAQISNFELLASKSYVPNLNQKTEVRLQIVCQYIHNEFTNPINLEYVASLISMNRSSFCRFFRQSTGQSLMEYVTDLRIGKASNLLLDDRNLSISEIAYRAGFNSQTLFNRNFKKKRKMTPSDFRNIKQLV